jgi:hypothetical protein
VIPQVVGQRRRARQGQPGDHRQDGGERDRRDEPEEAGAAQGLGQKRRRHVAAGVDAADRGAADQHRRAEAEDEGHQVEPADEPGGDRDRAARGGGVGHGVEAHQHVGQAGGAEHERDAQRDRLERAGHQLAGARTASP